MRIYLISDSHGHRETLRKMLEYVHRTIGPGDYYLHMGDGSADMPAVEDEIRRVNTKAGILQVTGNCDWDDRENPDCRAVTLGDIRIFMCHGHRYGVKYDKSVLAYAGREQNADLTLFGHTHEPFCELMGGTRLVNPGAAMDTQMGVAETDGHGNVTVKLLYLEEKI